MKTVLLVDDDAAVEGALRDADEVSVVRSPPDLAVAAARKLQPSVIVVSRWRDVARMRAACPSAALVYLVDVANEVERIAAFACGCAAYLVREERSVLVAVVEGLTWTPALEDHAPVAVRRARLH